MEGDAAEARAVTATSDVVVWAEWVRAHEGWRKDGFGRELDPQSCTTGKSIPVCGLTELAGDFSICFRLAGLKILSLMYVYMKRNVVVGRIPSMY